MTKPLLADDLAQADSLHREALTKIVYDLAAWLKQKRRSLKVQSARLRRDKNLAEARAKSEEADIYDDCYTQLKELRKKYGEQSARQSFFHYQQEELGQSQITTDPTPEEIAAECAKFQASWTPAEKARRGAGDPEPYEVRPIKCDHMFRK